MITQGLEKTFTRQDLGLMLIPMNSAQINGNTAEHPEYAYPSNFFRLKG